MASELCAEELVQLAKFSQLWNMQRYLGTGLTFVPACLSLTRPHSSSCDGAASLSSAGSSSIS